VIPVSAEDRPAAIRTASRLRSAGLRVDLALRDQSLGKGLKRAGQSGARVVVVLGSSERDSGELTVRDLASGEEEKMAVDDLVARLRERRPG
jgi:histidyl-tRNA synthetase